MREQFCIRCSTLLAGFSVNIDTDRGIIEERMHIPMNVTVTRTRDHTRLRESIFHESEE